MELPVVCDVLLALRETAPVVASYTHEYRRLHRTSFKREQASPSDEFLRCAIAIHFGGDALAVVMKVGRVAGSATCRRVFTTSSGLVRPAFVNPARIAEPIWTDITCDQPMRLRDHASLS